MVSGVFYQKYSILEFKILLLIHIDIIATHDIFDKETLTNNKFSSDFM